MLHRTHRESDHTLDIRIGAVRQRCLQHIPVTFIQILRLHDRDLYRYSHQHLAAYHIVSHRLIMSKHRNGKCRDLVRGSEVQLHSTIFRRIKERLERKRCREIIPYDQIGCILNYLERNGFINRFRLHICKIHGSCQISLRTRCTHAAPRTIANNNILIKHRAGEHSPHQLRIFNAVHSRDAAHPYRRYISLSAVDFRPIILPDLLRRHIKHRSQHLRTRTGLQQNRA